jgi:hypothetical protein
MQRSSTINPPQREQQGDSQGMNPDIGLFRLTCGLEIGVAFIRFSFQCDAVNPTLVMLTDIRTA